MKNIQTTIFTDGSSRGNPGKGGWAAILVEDSGNKNDSKLVRELGGREPMTTNNRMELTAALQGLSSSKIGANIMIYTDSSYVINGITKWVKGWKRNGWITKTKEAVLNRDLWEKLDEAASGKTIKWKYVKGHVGVVGNERCDHIATDFADGNRVELYSGTLAEYDLPNILDIELDGERVGSELNKSSRSKAKAYSYVSMVDGVIETHRFWTECEKRVKGKRGAKYKKTFDVDDEARIIGEFGAL